MSKLETEILEVTGARKQKAREDDQDYLERLVDAIYKLDDDEWDQFSKPAQRWYNEAARAINDQQDIPSLDDEEEEQEEKPKTRGRAKTADKPKPRGRGTRASKKEELEEEKEEEEESEGEEVDPDEIEAGMNVRLVTEDGEFTGEVTKVLSSGKVLLETEFGDKERILLGDIEEAFIVSDEEKDEEEDPDKDAGEDEEEISYDDLEEGLVVRVELDDDEVTGEVVKVMARSVSVKPEDGKAEKIMKNEIEAIYSLGEKEEEEEQEQEEEKPKTRGRRASTRVSKTDKETPRRGKRRSSKPDDEEKPKGKGPGRGRSTGVTRSLREILAGNPKMTLESLKKRAEKKGLDAAPQTINITYSGFMETYELLKEAGRIAS